MHPGQDAPAKGNTIYCSMNAHALGTLIKEAARRGARTARIMRRNFKATEKGRKSGNRTDWVTNADKEAQRVIVKKLRQWFPSFGIIGEESDVTGEPLMIPCTHPDLDIWFTIDPIDGTSAYIRRQSHGIGCMISLTCNNVIICVCIIDIMTGECYYFRPGSNNTWRIEDDIPEQMEIDLERSLSDLYILLREMPHKLSGMVQTLVHDGPFKDTQVTGGSIGISMAQLWKGEVGAAILSGSTDTPWDSNPVIGMSHQMGFDFWRLSTGTEQFVLIESGPVSKVQPLDHELLVIHSSRREEFKAWCRSISYKYTA